MGACSATQVKRMGTKKGQVRKTARRAYEKRMTRAKIATGNAPLGTLKAEVRKFFRFGGK